MATTTEYQSPIAMQVVERSIPGDPEADSKYQMLEVRHAATDELLATCMWGDDTGVERIADGLSAKRLWREANRLRAMHQNSRRRG